MLATALAGPGGSALEIIDKAGSFAWSDGTSVFTLAADHSFTQEPLGMSGRSVRGRWTLVRGKDAAGRYQPFYGVEELVTISAEACQRGAKCG